MEQNSLRNTSKRLGIQDEATIKKASEFLRSFHNKGSIKSLSLNDQAKTVLCLDLASTHRGASFDKEAAIKLAGLKKSLYQNNLHTVEKILGLDKQLTVSELCVQMSCTIIKDLADEILSKYSDNKKIKDVGHPQYITAAIKTACKIKHIQIPKTQLLAASHLKPSQWKELCAEFEKFTTALGIGSPRKKRKDINEIVSEIAGDVENKVILNKKEMEDEEVEDYEVWRKRILDEAYEALKVQKNGGKS